MQQLQQVLQGLQVSTLHPHSCIAVGRIAKQPPAQAFVKIQEQSIGLGMGPAQAFPVLCIDADGQAAAQLLTELIDIGDQQLPALEPALVLGLDQAGAVQQPELISRRWSEPVPAGQRDPLIAQFG